MSERTVTREVPNAKLYSDDTILLKGVRLSYPHVLKPRRQTNDDGKEVIRWDLVALLPKSTHSQAKDLVKSEIDRLCNDKRAKLGNDRKFLRNGDDANKPGYEGHYTIAAGETNKPSVRDRDRRPMKDDEDDRFYGGCWANVLIRPWFQDNKYGKRVNAGLVAVQFLRDGDRLAEGSSVSEEAIDQTFDDESQGWEDGDDDL